MNYTIRFVDMFAYLELSQYHVGMHEIFQNVLNIVACDISSHDQARFVLQ